MGIDIKSLVGDRAKSVKFDAVGDFGEGRITAAELVDDPQDSSRPRVLVITLADDDGGEVKLWARSSQMLEVIGEACDKAGTDGIEVGDHLKVTYTGEKTLKSGRTMKVYAAELTSEFGF
ncbi:MAG: hypothetical protein ACKOI2_09725 [Actinomycetota bacterium]